MGKLDNSYKKMQFGGPEDPKLQVRVPAKNFYANYISSSMYRKRLSNFGITDIPNIKNIANTNISQVNGPGSMGLNKDLSEVNSEDNVGFPVIKGKSNINIDKTQVKQLSKIYPGTSSTPEQVLTHELSHVSRDISPSEQILIGSVNKDKYAVNAYRKYRKSDMKSNLSDFMGKTIPIDTNASHDDQPAENKADLDALRYMMYKKGIYDTSKRDMTIDDYNKASRDPDINKSAIFNRLKRFNPKDLIMLNNTVAVNKTTTNELPQAKYGGDMKTTTKRTLSESYKARKMAAGGSFWDSDSNTNAISGGANFLGQGINAIDQPDAYGVRSGGGAAVSGALTGGAAGLKAGAAFGPQGAVIGAAAGTLIGGVTSVIGNNKAKKAKNLAIQRDVQQGNIRNQQRSDAVIAANPTLSTGSLNASYYAMGGTMKGTKSVMPRLKKPMHKIQPSQDLMPDIAEVPGRQISRMEDGGDLQNGPGFNIDSALNANKKVPFVDRILNGKKYPVFKNTDGTISSHRMAWGSDDKGFYAFPTLGYYDNKWVQNQTAKQAMSRGDIMRFSNEKDADAFAGGAWKSSKLNQVQTKFSVGGDMTKADIPYWMGEDGGGIHIKPSHEGRFTEYKKRTGKTTKEALHSSDPHVRQMANFAKNAAGWNKGADGGSLAKMSSQDLKVEGNSHANGGVKFPDANVELEGGETLNNGFVFSKKLGFAQQQEKVAKKLGKVEKMPDTALTRSTAQALQRQTETLKMAQEATKASMGIPNDLEQKATGGYIEDPDFPPGSKRPNPADSLSRKFLKSPPQSAPTYDASLLTNGQFLTTKDDGTTSQWGKPFSTLPDEVVPVPTNAPKILPSDKAVGLDNTYNPSRDRAQGKEVQTIQSPTGRNRYAMGGKLSKKYKMAMGGYDPTDPDDPKKIKLPPNPIPGMSLPTSAFPTVPFTRNGTQMNTQQVLPTGKKPRVSSANGPSVAGDNAGSSSTVKPPNGPRFPLPDQDIAPGSLPNIPELNTPLSPGVEPILSAPTNVKAGASPPTSSNKKGTLAKLGTAFDTISPFLSNIAAANRKLPLPPLPTMDDIVTPNTVDYSASRAEAVRQNRGANKSAEQNLNSGAAITASRAANLAGQTRAVNQINEAENNQNTGIRNQAQQVNSAIKSSNNAKTDNYNRDLVERQLKQQQLSSENLANVEEKIQGMARDKKLFDLEDQKTMLEALKDDTGASFRGARSIFAKHLSDDSLKQLDTHFTQLEADNKADRDSNRKASKLQLDYLKRRNSDQDKSVSDILGNVSTVTTAKEDNANRKKS